MNNDGWFNGAGPSDMQVARDDLQHGRQARTADEGPVSKRVMIQRSQAGGPTNLLGALQAERLQHEGL